MSPRVLAGLLADIRADGGATVHVGTYERPESGWAVSLAGCERRYDVDAFGLADIRAYLSEHHADLTGDDRYLGAWVDGGSVFLDVTIIAEDRASAEALGVVNGQRAVHCLATGETVTLTVAGVSRV